MHSSPRSFSRSGFFLIQALFVCAAQMSIGGGALLGGLMFDHPGLDTAFLVAAATAFVTAAMFASQGGPRGRLGL